jgi:asparagine synthase (glutamine-hydrolysing)
MCAINGFTFKDEGLARLMNAETKHRGPDGTRVWSDDRVTLGHNRLKIIDLSDASAQPMTSTDGRYVLVYNGELYNFKELKKELGEHRFVTSGDTEVVLEAYATWGAACVERFNGIFAFALWDTVKSELFLARDHSGIKPLYYTIHDGQLIFSSEIKGILVHSTVPRTVSRESLNQYLRLLYVPEPLTMISSIYKLPQGSRALFKNGTLNIETYVAPVLGTNTDSRSARIRTIQQKIDEAVERQVVSDRPVGVYLSGGIDSSVILDSMSRTHKNIKTYSVGFDVGLGEDSTKYNVDMNIARTTAALYGTDHHEIFLSSADALASFEEVVWHMDEPISNPTAWALFALSKATKASATVVLSGDGGDELFGGYERYRLGYAASLYQKLVPAFITRLMVPLSDALGKLAQDTWIERYAQFMFQKEDPLKRILSERLYDSSVTRDFFSRYMKGNNFEEALLETDRKTWLVDFALMLSDTMSMAHGVEVRVPFLDREVVEYALSIPVRDKLSLITTKKLLKCAFARRIPGYLFKQPKRGFFTPAAKWLRHEGFVTMARAVLSPEYVPATRELFNWDEVLTMFEKHVGKRGYNLSLIWALLTFQVWARRYKVEVSSL